MSVALQIFFAAVGASGELRVVLETAPALFIFCFIQIAIHLGLTLGIGHAAGFTRKELLLASNANVGGDTLVAPWNIGTHFQCPGKDELTHFGVTCTCEVTQVALGDRDSDALLLKGVFCVYSGPSTAAGMAAAKGWKSMLVPALLIGTFGYSCATFISLFLGSGVLMKMVPQL